MELLFNTLFAIALIVIPADVLVIVFVLVTLYLPVLLSDHVVPEIDDVSDESNHNFKPGIVCGENIVIFFIPTTLLLAIDDDIPLF
jgi:hypothetical protein